MKYLLLLSLFLMTTIGHTLSLKPDAPSRYVVKHGDSLWTIANRYLEHPWEWKQLLRANPNIKNPRHLYPGTILVLEYNADTPYIRVLPGRIVKLSPKMRQSQLDNAIPPIPLAEIKPFLNESLILDQNILDRAPYIIAYRGEHMLGGQGDYVYVKGLHPSKDLPKGDAISYSIFRSGSNYFDPRTKELLGYKATLVGYGDLVAGGEPATVVLTNINEGIKTEDKVFINNSPELDLYFEPKAPDVPVNGYIIDMPIGMPSGHTQEAVGEIIVINLGETTGVKNGDVLGIYAKARTVYDPKNLLVPIKLPPERIGEAMVFRAFTKTSFALIVRSTRAVYLMDTVSNP